MTAREHVVGNKYGSHTVVSELPDKLLGGRWRRMMHCRCDCGADHDLPLIRLKHLQPTTCPACCKRGMPVGQGANRKHGGYGTREYKAWLNMKARCYNKNHISYPYYGGRGIMVCARWRGPNDFANFIADMGPMPAGNRISLDRKDNDKDYTPQNCRWATPIMQANNRRKQKFKQYEIAGHKRSLPEWCALLDANPVMLRRRMKQGMSFIKALKLSRRVPRDEEIS